MKVVGVIVAGSAAYVVAVICLDFLRIDACLDLGGSWDREAEACVRDGMPIRSAYPTWVFGLSGAASIVVFVTTCVSFVATCTPLGGAAWAVAVVGQRRRRQRVASDA